MKETHKERLLRYQRERDEHREKLDHKYGVYGHPKAKRLYELAWDYGHGSGFSEVEFYYSELVDLIKEER